MGTIKDDAQTRDGESSGTVEEAGGRGDVGSAAVAIETAAHDGDATNVPRGSNVDHHTCADSPNDLRVVDGSSSSGSRIDNMDNERSRRTHAQTSQGNTEQGQHASAPSGAIGSGGAGDPDVISNDVNGVHGGNKAGQGFKSQRSSDHGGQSSGQEQAVTGGGIGVAAARPMVPDKEDDELVGGAPRHVSLQNYASADSGAVILESSPGSKGMHNLLVDKKDKYAISPCEEKQWAVFGLSEDIMVRTIKIISHEKYSSLAKDFQVLASQTYPVNEWLDLGIFTAKFTQGEQTFDLPQPAFARYLKFKFLTHYGDEFYCTVSQVKVHGSTMLESFQHEWQQSSAEVREVQDSLLMTLKDTAKSAATVGTNGNAAGVTAGSDAGSSNGGSTTPTGITPTPHSKTLPQSQIPTSTLGAPSGGGEGGVERRPHAASAATVPPLAEKRSGAGGDGNAAELTVEDIVRGVPTEMVVPASTCSGPTEIDGSCRGKMVTGRAVAGVAGRGAGESNPLAAEVPIIGAEIPGGTRPSDTETNGVGSVSVGGSRGVFGRSAVGGAGGNTDGDGAVAEGATGPLQSGGQTEGAAAGLYVASEVDQVRADTNAGIVDNAAGGSRSGEGDAAEINTWSAQAGDGEALPPRKGIITSTMEAISKAVSGSDGANKRKSGDGKPEDAGRHVVTAGVAPAAGVAGEEANPLLPSNFDSSAESEGTSHYGDRAGAVGSSGSEGSILSTSGLHSQDGLVTSRIIGEGEANTREAAYTGAASPLRPTAAGIDAATESAGSDAELSVGAGQGTGDRRIGKGIVKDADPVPSVHGVGVKVHKHTNTEEQALGAADTGAASVESSETGKMLRDGGATPGVVVQTHSSSNASVQPAAEAGRQEIVDFGEVKGPNADPTGAMASTASGSGSTQSTSLARGGHQQDIAAVRVIVGGRTETGEQFVPSDSQRHDESVGDGSAPQGGGHGGNREQLLRLAEINSAASAAACLNRPSFTEFRDEVLARTQQAQQSGGGVAIGGQYESIFKTLMNKIKTLEINQSLFSLYIDDVHGCYQDVLGNMLEEQERARTSSWKLLDAHSASLVKMGDQWPAFQDLQRKLAEVESRMLLSSMAWFTSLLCLAMMVITCIVKSCGFFGGSSCVKSNRGGGGAGAGRVARSPGKGFRRRGKDPSESPSACDFSFDRPCHCHVDSEFSATVARGEGPAYPTDVGVGSEDYGRMCGRCEGPLVNGPSCKVSLFTNFSGNGSVGNGPLITGSAGVGKGSDLTGWPERGFDRQGYYSGAGDLVEKKQCAEEVRSGSGVRCVDDARVSDVKMRS